MGDSRITVMSVNVNCSRPASWNVVSIWSSIVADEWNHDTSVACLVFHILHICGIVWLSCSKARIFVFRLPQNNLICQHTWCSIKRELYQGHRWWFELWRWWHRWKRRSYKVLNIIFLNESHSILLISSRKIVRRRSSKNALDSLQPTWEPSTRYFSIDIRTWTLIWKSI